MPSTSDILGSFFVCMLLLIANICFVTVVDIPESGGHVSAPSCLVTLERQTGHWKPNKVS